MSSVPLPISWTGESAGEDDQYDAAGTAATGTQAPRREWGRYGVAALLNDCDIGVRYAAILDGDSLYSYPGGELPDSDALWESPYQSLPLSSVPVILLSDELPV